MRQYCSGGSSTWSSIQPLFGRLQQRVVEEEEEPAAGREHPGHLGDGVVDVADVLEHQAGHDGVEGAVGERQRRRRRPGRRRVRRRARRASTTWAAVGSTPTTSVAPPRRGQPGDLPLAAADVEHPARAGEVLRRPAAGSAPRTRGRRPR